MTEFRRGVTAREFIRALHQDGFELQRVRGSHRVVVAYHDLGDTFPVGTLRGMIGDAGWTLQDFKTLGLA